MKPILVWIEISFYTKKLIGARENQKFSTDAVKLSLNSKSLQVRFGVLLPLKLKYKYYLS